MRRLLLLTLLTPMLVLSGPGASQASALPCPAPPSFGTLLDRAEFVFRATVDRIEQGDGEAAYQLTVRRVYAGSGVARQETVYASTRATDCQLDGVRIGEEWLIVSSGEPDRLLTSTAAGSREFTGDVRQAVTRRLGEGEKPEPDQPAPVPAATFTDVSDGAATDFWPMSLPGFALLGVGLVVLAAARGLSRRADRRG